MKTSEFDYNLPPGQIAQTPASPRDASRLLVLSRDDGKIAHRRFTDLGDYLNPGDMLVVNDSKVMPARLFGRKSTGGRVELLLLEQLDEFQWKALVGGKRVGVDTELTLDGPVSGLSATVTSAGAGPLRQLRFNVRIEEHLDVIGHLPLPPYIRDPLANPDSYQTVYARPPGSAAAPTAGLHFTADLLLALRDKGVNIEMVTLHVGLDTFKPVTAANVEEHNIHSEWAQLTAGAAKRINEAKLAGGRVIAVGTTAVRTLETAALRSAGLEGMLRHRSRQDSDDEETVFCPWRPVAAFEGSTDLFIYPGYLFRVVDGMLTNFHLPKSSLLMLVSAFAGYDTIMSTYETAVREGYRFYSFGDAMFIV